MTEPPATQPVSRVGSVALVGLPNVGKSTLLNRLLDYRLAIVSRKPQTTRHRILGVLTGHGHQILFLDTPGMMARPRDLLDRRMLARVEEALKEADLILMVTEPHAPGELEQRLVSALSVSAKPSLLAINKIDRVRKDHVLPVIDAYRTLLPFREIVPISARKGDGVDRLRDALVRHLPEGDPLFPEDHVTDLSERAVAAEMIREKLYEAYAEEIPYDTAVEIETFDEPGDEGRNLSDEHPPSSPSPARGEGIRKEVVHPPFPSPSMGEGQGRGERLRPKKTVIRAIVYVSKDSQKRILVGRGGEALKKVGTHARKAIEGVLGRSVYLELWVKVHPRWRRDEVFLDRIGY